MARTPSNMLVLDTPAPDFALIEPATGHTICLSDFADQPLLVAFICNHCPYVVHIRDAFTQMAREYQQRGVAVVAINSNDVLAYPEDSPEQMALAVKQYNFSFPYLFDATQTVAQAYQAACTPDLFLFNRAHRLYYRGQFDPARPRNELPVTGADLRHALERLLSDQPPPEPQIPSLGCNIKWKE